jgi:hypothetical protein
MSASKTNVPDIIIGVTAFLVIPLVTWVAVASGEKAQEAVGGPKKAAYTFEEVKEMKAEFERMYEQNAKLFIIRANAEDAHRDQERAWARAVLERCKKGFSDILVLVKERPASEDVLRTTTIEVEGWIRKIDDQIRTLAVPITIPDGS